MKNPFSRSKETHSMNLYSNSSAKKIMWQRTVRTTVFAIFLFCGRSALQAQTTISNLFSDHMVIQRGEPIKIWGWANDAAQINVILGSNTAQTTSQNGKWEVVLPAMDAGGPYQISIQAENTTTIQDVMIGDVWVAGGQSNMDWILKNTENAATEIAAANYPEIRFFQIPETVSNTVFEQVPAQNWRVANPEQAKIFSGVAWYFAKRNHLDKNVPVGIIDSNTGGSPAEAWMSIEAVAAVPSYAPDVANVLDPEKDWTAILAQNKVNDSLRFAVIADTLLAKVPTAHLLDFDDGGWQCVQIPNTEPILDFVWLRKNILLKGTEQEVKLNLGKMETRGQVFFNEKLIYNKTTTNVDILSIPTELLREGKNVISCRVANPYGGRAYFGYADNMWMEIEGTQISLEGEWKYSNTVEPELPEVKTYRHLPSFLYNSMIAPLTNFAVRGVIWYQGESNAFRSSEYNELFEALIQDWRNRWQKPDMPFLFVQLPNYQAREEQPSEHNWAYIREAQTQALSVNNTGMTTTIDIGDANDIHPRNKKDVGERLWRNARKASFGEDIISSGPMYLSHEVVNDTISVSFEHIGAGLQTNDGNEPVGFAIAGADQVFYWADAQIQDGQVKLSTAEVTAPVAVRYAWAVNPATNLYNSEGLPAVPFRTDDW